MLRQYFVGGVEVTEAEAREIETRNREILLDGTIEELLSVRPVSYKEA